jgi:hypothetical protein
LHRPWLYPWKTNFELTKHTMTTLQEKFEKDGGIKLYHRILHHMMTTEIEGIPFKDLTKDDMAVCLFLKHQELAMINGHIIGKPVHKNNQSIES